MQKLFEQILNETEHNNLIGWDIIRRNLKEYQNLLEGFYFDWLQKLPAKRQSDIVSLVKSALNAGYQAGINGIPEEEFRDVVFKVG
jgi:hypothetical protein